MYPMVDTYEVMPWPDRIYQGLYRIAGTDQKERIPRSYSTQMQTMVNTLNDIRTSDKKDHRYAWHRCTDGKLTDVPALPEP